MAFQLTGRDRGRALVAALAPVLLCASMSACSATADGEQPCFPPAYSVEPSEARPGENVTVEAPDADCNPRYGENASIEVIVTDAAGADVVRGTAAMSDAGKFSYTFVVPARTAVGDAAVIAMPYNIDWCDDTGRNNRVAGAGPVLLERASCAMPVKPLLITR